MDIFTNNLSILEVMIVMIRLVWVQALLQQKIGKQPGPSESMMSLFRFKWCRDFRGELGQLRLHLWLNRDSHELLNQQFRIGLHVAQTQHLTFWKAAWEGIGGHAQNMAKATHKCAYLLLPVNWSKTYETYETFTRPLPLFSRHSGLLGDQYPNII